MSEKTPTRGAKGKAKATAVRATQGSKRSRKNSAGDAIQRDSSQQEEEVQLVIPSGPNQAKKEEFNVQAYADGEFFVNLFSKRVDGNVLSDEDFALFETKVQRMMDKILTKKQKLSMVNRMANNIGRSTIPVRTAVYSAKDVADSRPTAIPKESKKVEKKKKAVAQQEKAPWRQTDEFKGLTRAREDLNKRCKESGGDPASEPWRSDFRSIILAMKALKQGSNGEEESKSSANAEASAMDTSQ